MYDGLLDFDKSKMWQRSFGLYDSDSSSEEEEDFDDHKFANPDTLKSQLE